MTAVLVASFAFGFFAAGLLSVFWLVVLAGPVALVASVVAEVQGSGFLHAIGFGVALFALVQVGFAIGLVRVAALAKRYVPD